jgi:hypothetical protein
LRNNILRKQLDRRRLFELLKVKKFRRTRRFQVKLVPIDYNPSCLPKTTLPAENTLIRYHKSANTSPYIIQKTAKSLALQKMEQKLIGSLLEEKEEAEDPQSRYPKTLRNVLLNPAEMESLKNRSATAPPEFSFFTDS